MARAKTLTTTTAVKVKSRDASARRTKSSATAIASAPAPASARRRQAGSPPTPKREETTLELEFVKAMHEYKHASGRMFPTWSEVLEVLQNLGYRKLSDECGPVLSETGTA